LLCEIGQFLQLGLIQTQPCREEETFRLRFDLRPNLPARVGGIYSACSFLRPPAPDEFSHISCVDFLRYAALAEFAVQVGEYQRVVLRENIEYFPRMTFNSMRAPRGKIAIIAVPF